MKSKLFLLIIAGFFLTASSAAALNFGDKITIYDGSKAWSSNSTYNQWWNTENEDQEVEPNDQVGQGWDLEGFFLDGSKLTAIGGFNFIDGYEGYKAGDIFIDTNGEYSASYSGTGDGYQTVTGNFGYEYVLDMDYGSGTYDVYALDSEDSSVTVYYRQNDASNPLRYASGGQQILSGLSFGYLSGLSDDETGLSGGTHNAVTVDLGFLADVIPGEEFTAHLTIGCGNDNLMGRGVAPVPEPTTILLSGLGLLGMGLFLRRQKNRKLAH